MSGFNLSDTTPAPPAGKQNIKWQRDNNDPFNVSAYVDAGGGSGAVSSVNGETGDVVLTAEDVDAIPNNASVANITTLNSTTVNATDVNLSGDIGADNISISGDFTSSTSHIGTATISGKTTTNQLEVTSPTNITLGDGWIDWTPAITCGGSMTATSINILDAQYLRVGPLCYVKATVSMTLGGTADLTIFSNIPVPLVGSLSALSTNVYVAATALWKPGFSYVADGNIVIQYPYAATFPLGFAEVMFSGVYRCA
jgi:hypothetical protein